MRTKKTRVETVSLVGFPGIAEIMRQIPRVPPSTNFFAMPFFEELTLMPWRNRNKTDVEDRAFDGSVVLHLHGFRKNTLLGVSVSGSPFIIAELQKQKRPLTMAQVIRFAVKYADEREKHVDPVEVLSEKAVQKIAQMRAKALRFVYRNGNPKIPKVILKDIEEMRKKKAA